MSLIVQKFGGTSVQSPEHLRHVAELIGTAYRAGHDVLAVLSAQGNTTDQLVAKAAEITRHPSRREMDMLLSTGEQVSVALCAMALEESGLPCVSLTGWQAGIQTNCVHGDARIEEINSERIRSEFLRHRIVLVTGFQGVNSEGDITTLGRGGSDTSAVALAGALDASLCQIYTDVEGVYTADPRIVPNARKLEEISYDEMLELAAQGAKVLHRRSVETAKQYGVDLEVLSSMTAAAGTKVRERVQHDGAVTGVTRDAQLARLILEGIPAGDREIAKAAAWLERQGIIPAEPMQAGEGDAFFLLPAAEAEGAAVRLEQAGQFLGLKQITVKRDTEKISVIGPSPWEVKGQILSALEKFPEPLAVYETKGRLSLLMETSKAIEAILRIHGAIFE